MKQVFLFLLLSTLSVFTIQAQKVDFKLALKPNYTYQLNQTANSLNTITFIGSEEDLQSLANEGIENPTIVKDSTYVLSVIRNGKLIGNEFPTITEILESTDPSVKAGSIYYGRIVDGLQKTDSIVSDKMTEAEKEMIVSTMDSFLGQLKLPEKKMKIGDSIETKNPITLTIAGVTLEMETISVYVLKSVRKKVAYFDLYQDIVLKTQLDEMNLHVEGGGSGHLLYDTKAQYFSELNLSFNMDFILDYDFIKVQFNSVSDTLYKVDITKNKK